jgi:hypothetical protein
MASIRSEAEFRALYRLTHSEYIDLHKKICQHDPTYSGGQHARGLDSRLKLLSALRFLAGGDVKDVLIAHGQSRTTFWRHLEAPPQTADERAYQPTAHSVLLMALYTFPLSLLYH